MSGELTFSADASIEVPYEMDWSVIADQLDEVATKLGVDILLDDDSGQ
jgi:glycine cleavage system regulatory protein